MPSKAAGLKGSGASSMMSACSLSGNTRSKLRVASSTASPAEISRSIEVSVAMRGGAINAGHGQEQENDDDRVPRTQYAAGTVAAAGVRRSWPFLTSHHHPVVAHRRLMIACRHEHTHVGCGGDLGFLAPGYPGGAGDAQPFVDQFAKAAAAAAGWDPGSLAAIYDPTEQGGLAKLDNKIRCWPSCRMPSMCSMPRRLS